MATVCCVRFLSLHFTPLGFEHREPESEMPCTPHVSGAQFSKPLSEVNSMTSQKGFPGESCLCLPTLRQGSVDHSSTSMRLGLAKKCEAGT